MRKEKLFYCKELNEFILDSVDAVRTSLEETRQRSGRTLPHILLDDSMNCIEAHVFAIFRKSGSDKMCFQIGKEQFNWIKVFPSVAGTALDRGNGKRRSQRDCSAG